MNVLVVGGAGYVGGAVTDLLAESQHSLRVYDSLLYEEAYRKPVAFVCGDVRDAPRLGAQLDWADAVVWLAAVVGDKACAVNPQATEEINVHAAAWMASRFDGRVVFLSTCSVYGAQADVLTEESKVAPLSLYADTKLRAEQLLAGRNALVFRLGTLFGVSDSYSRLRLDLVLNTLTVRAFQGDPLTVFGGEQFRPLVHVFDAAAAIVAALDSDLTGVFNLNRQNVRIIDLACQIRSHFPDARIQQTEAPYQDTRNYRVSCQKLRTALGFAPRLSIDDGIEEIRDILHAQRVGRVDNPRYRNHAFLDTHQARLGFAKHG